MSLSAAQTQQIIMSTNQSKGFQEFAETFFPKLSGDPASVYSHWANSLEAISDLLIVLNQKGKAIYCSEKDVVGLSLADIIKDSGKLQLTKILDHSERKGKFVIEQLQFEFMPDRYQQAQLLCSDWGTGMSFFIVI